MNVHFFSKQIAAGCVNTLAAILFLHITIPAVAHANENSFLQIEFPADEGVFFVGEELMYNVSYSLLDIGKVTVQITDTVTKQGTKVYRAKAYIDSYNVPFVDLHQVFYSEITPQPYSVYFSMHNTAKPEKIEYTLYSFNYESKSVEYENGTKPKKVVLKKGKVPIGDYQQDGLSLFYFARRHAREKKKVTTPVFINEKTFLTSFNFLNKVGAQKIGAVQYPVETVELEGNANFIGIFGLTGYFQGFFSNDEAAIPIVAKMKVLIGSIHIELVKWNRSGWVPPKAK